MPNFTGTTRGRLFLAEKVGQVFLNEKIGLLATFINATVLVAVQWTIVPSASLLTWYALVMAVTLPRMWLHLARRGKPFQPQEAARWAWILRAGVGLSGVAWGLAGVLVFPPGDTGHQIFTAFVLGGMVAGAAAAYAPLEGAFIAFSLPCLLPILAQFLRLEGDMHMAMGGMLVLFFILIYFTSRRVQAATWSALALRHENEGLIGNRAVVDNAHEGICVVQEEGFEFANPALLGLTGYTWEELARLPLQALFHPEDRETALDRYRRRLAGEAVPEIVRLRLLRKSGGELWVEASSVAISWKGRPATLNFLRDISERRRLEEQLLIAQKMESIGTLAGGIAHDFNNLLTAIGGSASLLLDERPEGHPDRAWLESIGLQVKKGEELTRQLLGFAGRGKYRSVPTDLNALVEGVARLYGRTRKDIRLQISLNPGLWPVEADPDQLNLVLLNICINAGQAMPEGGELALATANRGVDPAVAEAYRCFPGDYVRISIADSGEGMDRSIIPRIFDPFFTTKGMGKGAGLGLASAYGIIRNHGGFIEVHTEKGLGTTFALHLPRSRKPVPGRSEEAARRADGGKTLLLVDDEEVVAAVGTRLLQRLGHRVLAARSGEEAVEIFAQQPGSIDLVLLDIIMPGMGGEAAFARLREIDPSAKILLTSGFSLESQTQALLEKGRTEFLPKPYDLGSLSRKIQDMLSLSPQRGLS